MVAWPHWPRAASGAVLWFPPIPDGAPGALSPIHYANWEEPESQTLGQQIFAGGKNKKELVWLSLDTFPAARNPNGAKRATLPQFLDCSSLSWFVPAADPVMSPMVFKVTTT